MRALDPLKMELHRWIVNYHCECWEPNFGHLEEQEELLAAQRSPQPYIFC